jgi:hypothetical protein
MPIIRITKEQIAKANKAREAALRKDPDFRAHEERKRLAASAARQKERVKAANEAQQQSGLKDSGCPPHAERELPQERKTSAGREKERPS